MQESQLRAENCLKFISLLQGPCEDLKAAEPSAIPTLLPRLLTTVRVIWNNSEHYKSRERLNGLLRRVSIVHMGLHACAPCACMHACVNAEQSKIHMHMHTYTCQCVQCKLYINTIPIQVSSDIIKQCCQKIVLEDLFEGRVEKSKAALQVREESLSNNLTSHVTASLGELDMLPEVERCVQPYQQSPQHLLRGRMGAG